MRASTPEDTDRLFSEAVNAGNLDELITLYEPAGVLVAQDGSLAIGHKAIRAALEGLVGAKPRIRMNVLKVVRAGDDLAMLYNDWVLTAAGPDGGPVEMTGKALEIVRRQKDGSWLYSIDDPYARM